VSRIKSDIEIQAIGPATENARQPWVLNRKRGSKQYKQFFRSFDVAMASVHATDVHAHIFILPLKLPSTQYNKKLDQLSPRDRAICVLSGSYTVVRSNLANYHATVQKLLIRQVLTIPMVWCWRFNLRQYVMNNVHSTMTRPNIGSHCLTGVINKPTTVESCISQVCIPTTCCGEII